MKSENEVLIRALTLEDYDAVYRLWMETPGMGLNDVDDSREGIARYLRRNPSTCFVAVEGQALTGVILCGHDGRRGYIHHMAVRACRQKQGIGSQLLEHALKALEQEGITKVALVVFERNEKGNAFWERKGFPAREDLIYRNRTLRPLKRIDT